MAKPYVYVAVGVLLIALVGGGLFLLTAVGVAVFSPQLTHLVGPGFSVNPNGNGYVQQAFSDFQQPPIFAILKEWPNGSWSAQVWVYNPNTLSMRGAARIQLIAPNGSGLWWGTLGYPTTNETVGFNTVCPFTWGYTDEWTWTNASVKSTHGTASPPGFFSQLNEPGWNASAGIVESYSVGGIETFEYFVYVGNHTWVATPAAPVTVFGTSPFQIYREEIPPDFPYGNLVTDINDGPRPSWWGHPGLASCP